MSPSAAHARSWLSSAADLLLGAQCPGCGAAGLGLCGGCSVQLACVRPLAVSRPGLALPLTVVAGPYAGVLLKALLAHKEHQALGLARALGGSLMTCAAHALGSPVAGVSVLVVAVPSTPGTVRRRGYDATGQLATELAGRLRDIGWDARASPVLRHTRAVRDQGGLSSHERLRNLHGALLSTASPRPGRGVLLVDDVVTTGATLAEAARAVHATGTPVLAAVALATQELCHEPHHSQAAQGSQRMGAVGDAPTSPGATAPAAAEDES